MPVEVMDLERGQGVCRIRQQQPVADDRGALQRRRLSLRDDLAPAVARMVRRIDGEPCGRSGQREPGLSGRLCTGM
jgi:hypothetical protein